MLELPTRLRTRKDLHTLIAHVTTCDQKLAEAYSRAGAPFYRKRKQGFESLLKIVVEQQLSRASADAIWGRLQEKVQQLTPKALLSASEADLRGVGLSRPKIRYARTLAEAVETKALDLSALPYRSDERVMEELCAVTGIGRWTAEIYMLFCLGRPNVWPAGDVAVQAAVEMVLGLDQRPDAGKMDELAEKWHPVRGVAALILWQFYRHVKNRPVWV